MSPQSTFSCEHMILVGRGLGHKINSMRVPLIRAAIQRHFLTSRLSTSISDAWTGDDLAASLIEGDSSAGRSTGVSAERSEASALSTGSGRPTCDRRNALTVRRIRATSPPEPNPSRSLTFGSGSRRLVKRSCIRTSTCLGSRRAPPKLRPATGDIVRSAVQHMQGELALVLPWHRPSKMLALELP